jgi:transcriptional regulator with XRE-family HTH domain
VGATLVDNIDPMRLRELMVERDIDVAALAAAAGVSDKTVHTVLRGSPVSLGTVGKVYRALGGDLTGFSGPRSAPSPRSP